MSWVHLTNQMIHYKQLCKMLTDQVNVRKFLDQILFVYIMFHKARLLSSSSTTECITLCQYSVRKRLNFVKKKNSFLKLYILSLQGEVPFQEELVN